MLSYPVDLTPDGDTLLVTCAVFPELTSFGVDEADALRMASDALEEVLYQRLRAFAPIPRPGDGPHRAMISLQTSLKLLLYWSLGEAGLNRAELARRLHWKRPQVDRLFDASHATRVDQFEAAFAALGRRPVVEIAHR